MEPLTPNTSAFLSYISNAYDSNNVKDGFTDNIPNNVNTTTTTNNNDNNPSSLPPSAFFPIPGRDTPQDTPSSIEASQSPPEPLKKNTGGRGNGGRASLSGGEFDLDSPEREEVGRNDSAVTGNHKRKAGQGNAKHDEEDESDDDSASDFATGHEDKRAHAAGTQPSGSSGSGRKGSRNSTGGEEGTGPRTTKDVGKAARRKEQNRAAQKAFRERREAKVRDLEEKIAELEAKSYGASVENENLREILKRLQEENVALRQSAFTFSMPMGGSPVEGRGGTGGNTPNNRANASTAGIKQRQVKPPSPPTSISDDSLKSINDPPVVPHRNSSAMGESPDSLISINSGNGSSSDSAPVNLFNSAPNAFDATAVGGRPSLGDLNSVSSSSGIPSFNGYARSDSGVSPRSSTSNPRTEVDALWADFLQTSPATQAKQSTTKGQGQNQNQTSQPGWSNNNNVAPSPFSLLNSQTNPMSFASNDTKVCGETGNKNAWDKSAFRDESAGAAPFAQVPEPQAQKSQQPQQIQPTQAVQNDPWAGMMGSSVNDFLASLNGVDSNAVGQDADWNTGDDDFNAQLQQLLGTNVSPGAAFNLPNSGGNPFSPTNYLNMSPSPLNSGSNEASPQSQANSGASNSASPESSLGVGSNVSRNDPMGSGVGTLGAAKTDAEQVHLIDETGKILKPSEIWLRMGVQTDNNLEHLVVDDLCDMMRSKATCKDGKHYLQAKDAEEMFKVRTVDTSYEGRTNRQGACRMQLAPH